LFDKASELQLDDIVGVKASGNNEILFIHDIFFPDAILDEKTKFDEDICIAFLSDVHCGSDRHLEKSFSKFLNWVESDDEMVKKIKYLFFVGDNVDGVGVFPGQEEVLKLKNMEEQYSLLASYLRRIPKHITIFMCPGQHDATRVAEPQPIISKKYAEELYGIENLVLVTNPTYVKLLEGEKEFNVLMYHGASIHSFINEIKELREMKAHKCPAKAIKHMLKRRHLAPSHGDVVYIPNAEKDPMVISEVPDVLCTGEVHRLDIENYNGVLIITGSCWQAQTDFEEKIGNIPDPCKVPVLNLKTREMKIFDFGVKEEVEKWM
jgi:DNA polymerase II small subunit